MTNLKDTFPVSLRKTLLLFFTACVALSCARSANPDIKRGSTYRYRPGYPEVRFSAVGFLNEDNTPTINIAADIVYASLIYKEQDSLQQAHLAIDVRIVKKEKDNDIISSKHYEIDVNNKEDDSIITSQDSYVFDKRIDVPAGSYKVYFSVTDKNSGKTITRTTDTSIPNPSNNTIDLTDIRMLAKNMDDETPKWLPITTYTVPGKIDSLMFIFQATNNSSQQPLSINANLIRFDSDTSIARPMNYSNYSPSSIEYQGIEYDDKEII